MTPARWASRTDPILMVAALVFLTAYATPIIWPDLPSTIITACTVASWTTWALFAVDYLARVVLAEDRRAYVRAHWIDLAIIALPLLRPLRLLRLATLLGALNRRASTNLRGRLATYVAGSAVLLAFCGALAVLDAERANPEANITGFGDAIWWALTTMTTVGYGDRYPTTGTGRLAAALLMLGGIAVLGVVTATIASWLVEHIAAEQETSDGLRDQVAALSDEIRALRAEQSSGRRLDGGP